jgi:hypothetical protein
LKFEYKKKETAKEKKDEKSVQCNVLETELGLFAGVLCSNRRVKTGNFGWWDFLQQS